MIQSIPKEQVTQKRLLKVLTDGLGWTYLGKWQDRVGNAAIEEALLREHLVSVGYDEHVANKAVAELTKAANNTSRPLYDRNQDVYTLLRYGTSILPEHGDKKIRVQFIDWQHVGNNAFGFAEEVSVTPSDPAAHTKRPDIVLYVNGIALGIIELKRSNVSVSEGIRQNLDNQKKTFIEGFFSTMQLVMAGNDTEGLRYGTIQTPEKYYLQWKEQGAEEAQDLDSAVVHLCSKERFLEIIHDFVVFDAGIKKVCRPNQYFGVKAAQAYATDQRGGIIWHTQGSGKSLSMVWLAKWIRENIPDSRILIVTDRDELDKQIEKVFAGVSENMYRAKSGQDLVTKLNDTTPALLCSLIHKFGSGSSEASAKDVEKYVSELENHLPSDFRAKGNFYVFVDEAHRTQAGVLHRAMKALLPKATFIGFTGTPLLKSDKASTLELFGPFIHQYRYDEAVRDGVVLDLQYEARDIPQRMTGQDKVDKWFDAKTSGLNDIAKAALKKKWGTFQKVRSSQSRLSVIVSDILLDMNTRPRLMDGHGNAILVASSIYEACRYYEMFSKTELNGKVAIVSSYSPDISDIKGEESGDGDTESIEKYETYRRMLAEWFNTTEEDALTKISKFEDEAKKRFVDQPGQLKLLIVVDKLLTGFDAPSATYLYIDKPMQDHGLFQAICRVNRLDGDDKEYGYVIDYKDLFKSLEEAVNEYTSGAFDGYDSEDVAGILGDRLSRGKERLDDLLEQTRALCEPVREPRGVEEFVSYFVSKRDASDDVRVGDERNRVTFYRLVSSLITTYSDLASEMVEAGYEAEQAASIKSEIARYTDMREVLKLASGDAPDLKAYEPGMRQLIDTYIKSDDSRKVSDLDDLGFLDLFINNPKGAVDSLPSVITSSTRTVAATIENNIRKVIVDESPTNPKYYEKMSTLLSELIDAMRNESISYKEYLAKVAELAEKVRNPGGGSGYPLTVDTVWKQAIYDNFGQDEELAIRVDEVVVTQAQDGWQFSKPKRRLLGRQIQEAVSRTRGSLSDEELDQLLDLLAAQRGI